MVNCWSQVTQVRASPLRKAPNNTGSTSGPPGSSATLCIFTAQPRPRQTPRPRGPGRPPGRAVRASGRRSGVPGTPRGFQSAPQNLCGPIPSLKPSLRAFPWGPAPVRVKAEEPGAGTLVRRARGSLCLRGKGNVLGGSGRFLFLHKPPDSWPRTAVRDEPPSGPSAGAPRPGRAFLAAALVAGGSFSAPLGAAAGGLLAGAAETQLWSLPQARGLPEGLLLRREGRRLCLPQGLWTLGLRPV